MDIEKLKSVLIEMGIEPEKIDAIIAAMSEEPAPEEPQSEGNPEEGSTPDEVPVEEEPEQPNPEGGEPPVEEEGEVVPPLEEGAVDPDSVPPVPPEEELVPSVEESQVPPVLPEMPPVVSIEEFNDVKNELEETKKALEGVKAQCESLLEALKGAGVISGPTANAVGQSNPSLPGGKVNTTLDDVLSEINRKGY